MVGRVPGDYPVPAGIALPGITRTRPGITSKCGRILSSEQLDLVSAMATGSVICVAVT